MSKKIVKTPLPSSSLHQCGPRFSSYMGTKTTYRNRLNAEADMSCFLFSQTLKRFAKMKNIMFFSSFLFCKT